MQDDVVAPEPPVTPEPEVNNAPVISGATNKTIEFGETFSALEGVTATDAEDGNITSSIKVIGSVNTQVAGTYTLTYTVTDSGNLTTTVVRVITVNAEIVPEPEVEPEVDGEYPIWSRAEETKGTYVPGYMVSHLGGVYKQVSNRTTWWCEPGTNSNVWAVV